MSEQASERAPSVTILSDAQPLREAFNNDADRARVLLLVSPT